MAKILQEGDISPSFTLPADGGGEVSLADFKGRSLVLYFYPKDDTSGCTKEAIAFSGLRGAFEQANASVLGVSRDSVDSHDRFKAKYGLDLRLASDESLDMLNAYGVWMEKSMYGRKYMGIDRSTFLIDGTGRIARIWRNVKVPDHAEEVLEAAKALTGARSGD